MVNKSEAAQTLGVSTRTLDRMVAAGKIAAVQYSPRGKVLFDPLSLQQLQSRRLKNATVLRDKSMESPKPTTRTTLPASKSNDLLAFLDRRVP